MAGCDEADQATEAPPPVALTREAMGHFCGMTLVEHPGPKGQILLRGNARPVWFSSARDAIAFTLLDEESKAIRAIYVSDMAKAQTWEDPGATNWVEARQAWFVLGSDRRGGMGAEEAVPFSDQTAAERFAAAHGGRVLRLTEVPRDWVLGEGSAPPGEARDATPPRDAAAAPHRH
nr:nitrous oxide reductase accessory protein NosL [Roseicella aerolata]